MKNIDNTQIINLKNDILNKNNQIIKLNQQLQNINLNNKASDVQINLKDIKCVNFISSDQNIKYAVPCSGDKYFINLFYVLMIIKLVQGSRLY